MRIVSPLFSDEEHKPLMAKSGLRIRKTKSGETIIYFQRTRRPKKSGKKK